MKYTYTAAWVVIGGISLRDEDPPITLVKSDNIEFILTRDPDSFLVRVDEATAVGRLMLKGLIGQRAAGDFPSALTVEVDEIKAERTRSSGSNAVLLTQAHGDVAAEIKGPHHEHDTFVVAFDVVDKNALIQAHQADIEAIKTAVAFESETPSRFSKIGDGVCLFTEEGKPVYSISFEMSADISVSTPVSPEAAERITARYVSLKQENDLNSVQRLFSQMAVHGSDRLKAFLSGWAALEILIGKSFKAYEQIFLSPFTNADQPGLRERFLFRVKEVMKDKYRLTDKFVAVTAVLFPSIDHEEAKANYEAFNNLKKVRDSIFHGEPFSEKDLPIDELSKLLRRYVIARVATPNKSLNSDVPDGTPVS